MLHEPEELFGGFSNRIASRTSAFAVKLVKMDRSTAYLLAFFTESNQKLYDAVSTDARNVPFLTAESPLLIAAVTCAIRLLAVYSSNLHQ